MITVTVTVTNAVAERSASPVKQREPSKTWEATGKMVESVFVYCFEGLSGEHVDKK